MKRMPKRIKESFEAVTPNILPSILADCEEVKAERMLSALYEYYTKYPEQMSEYNGEQIEKWGVETVVCDYLSGMTDRYAVSTFNSIFIPKNWKI